MTFEETSLSSFFLLRVRLSEKSTSSIYLSAIANDHLFRQYGGENGVPSFSVCATVLMPACSLRPCCPPYCPFRTFRESFEEDYIKGNVRICSSSLARPKASTGTLLSDFKP